MAFSINLTDNERKLACAYAKMHSITLGEAFKHALFEKIEDEYDTKIADEAYDEYINNGKESRPIEELWEELDIWVNIQLRRLKDSIENLKN